MQQISQTGAASFDQDAHFISLAGVPLLKLFGGCKLAGFPSD